ncbi:MAG: type I-E CRISPR-associated protein Cse2/CasB [Bacillota bacterium]|nr:type I-E CRISPR-associated protein Cse2/CasB [Bacillota bacterium]
MTEKTSKTKLVFSTTNRVISIISNSLETSRTKANLAKLRNSVGKSLGENPSNFQIIYENMAEELLNPNFKLSKAEEAVITSLQLYAIHQQSKSYSVNEISENKGWDNFGNSLSFLRTNDDNTALDNRFNAMITSSTFDELINHLRQLVKLLRSSDKNIKVNYPKLSTDLYKFLNGDNNTIKLNWARAYYFTKEKGEEKNDK